ncbi:ROK family protein [Mesobacillus harenae]|uniref:ROK family protein n=1 Tax=Mesobacillus harenae TaxID=2213203 RepID=UPI0015802742|nr:ROK family protein [Mesobacillus harenae]
MKNTSIHPRKKMYKGVIFKAVQNLGQTTRVELSTKLGVNKNTVSTIVDELIYEGLIKEGGTVSTKNVGRNPTNLEVDPEAFQIIGMSISADQIILTLTDFHGKPIHTELSKNTSHDVDSVKNKIIEMIRNTLNQFKDKKTLGIGIGVPGILSDNKEGIKYSSHLKWNNVELKRLIIEELDMEINIQLNNSVKMAAIGEIYQSSVTNKETVFYCNIGHGVGGSIVIDGKTLEGANHSAGEFGHITIDPSGPLCNCGNRGCLESLISSPNLVYLAIEKIRSNPDSPMNDLLQNSIQAIEIEDLVAFANKREAIAVEIIRQAGQYLGTGLSYVVNLLNPDRIILSGNIVKAEEILFESIKTELRKRCLPTSLQTIQIESSSLGTFAVSIGAATSVIYDWVPKNNTK